METIESIKPDHLNRSATGPVKLAVTGAGGYAAYITDLVLRVGDSCQPPVELVSIAEPDAVTHAERLAALRQRGVMTVSSIDELLADPGVEAVWLPVPIPLHRPFAERALAAGKAVLVEKPAAGTVQDVDSMIAARDQAKLPAMIAFQHMYDPLTAEVKRRLIAGEIGTIRHAVLHACWPRSEQYYRRSAWAGRFKQGDAWVMDSPANNALAHYLNLALFFLGSTFSASASPERLEAELYRAHSIENFDTASLRVHMAGGATLLGLLTHACQGGHYGPILRLEGTRGQISWTTAGAEIETESTREWIAASGDTEAEMLNRFARLVRGLPDEMRLGSTLETARTQVLIVNAASEATPIIPVPTSQIERFESHGEKGVAIVGIEAAIKSCAEHRLMLHESGLLPFTRPAGILDMRQYREFGGPRLCPPVGHQASPTPASMEPLEQH